MIYDETDALSENAVLAWYAEAQKAGRETNTWQRAAPFVKWLEEAEEESDEDEDSDE